MSKAKDFTVYEVARIIGARALQLSMGAPPLVDVGSEYLSPVALAKLEFDASAVPLKVLR